MKAEETPVRAMAAVLALFVVLTALMVVVMWPRDDTPEAPDAVVVLGGAGEERAELGMALAAQHDAKLVLSSSAQHFAARRGVRCGDSGVLCLEPDPPTTIGEARDVADLAAEHEWTHVTVATTRFHVPRARVAFRQCLGDAVSVVGAVRPDDGALSLRRDVREAVGVLLSWTVRRAC